MTVNLRRCRDYIETFLKIKDKRGDVVPFRLNPAQLKLYDVIGRLNAEHKPVRVIILKARQLGFSTFAEGMLFWSSATSGGVESLIVAHRDDSTAKLYSMSRLFLDNLPPEVRPMTAATNAQEIRFANPSKDPRERLARPGLLSRIRCVTAGGKGIGRGETITNVHASEFAFWPGDKSGTLLGIMQAVPNAAGTSVIIESTANGFDEFKGMWDAAVCGESDFIPVFFAWYENPEYRMTAEPDFTSTAEEKEIADAFGLDDDQLTWRRWCIRNNCSGDIDKFRQEYPATPDEAFLMSGSPVFDNGKVLARLKGAPEPVAVGEFEYKYDGLAISEIKFTEKVGGCISIYKKPVKRWPYVIGGDTAGEGSDWFVGQVLDNTTGEQVATLRHQFDEDIYARQMYCLGMFYNTALLGVEINYSTHPVRELSRLGYPRQYSREVMDDYTGKVKTAFGFNTNLSTRPVAVAGLVSVVRDTPQLINDSETLREMLVFAYDDRRRPASLPGEHDDTVMALAIAYMIRGQQSFKPSPVEPERRQWTSDMYDDFDRASAVEKDKIIKKWGYPQ